MTDFSVIPQDKGFALQAGGRPMLTPAKHALVLPTRALAEAIQKEWQGGKKFSPAAMPLTALAYTAIDQMEARDIVTEALMAYLDTDTICYRASAANISQRQQQEWDPVLRWAGGKFNAIWQSTTGINALNQPEALHESVSDYLHSQDAMRLAAACMLASGFSSLALMLAVMEKHLGAKEAFRLSRLEEELQAEKWGHDEEAAQRALKMQEEILQAERFLRLLSEG